MPGEGTRVDNERLDRIEKRMAEGFDEIKGLMSGMDVRLRTIETTEARCQSVQEIKVAAIGKTVDEHETRLDIVEKWIPAVKVLVWIGGVLGVSVVGLIWGIITHTIVIAVK